MKKTFNIAPALGVESDTGLFFVDSAGKAWPIYQKIIDMGPGPAAAAADSVAYAAGGVVKADGHFRAYGYYTKAATAPVITGSAALAITMTLTNVIMTPTADMTTYQGRVVVEYCKAAD
jgi:hypothetical protein